MTTKGRKRKSGVKRTASGRPSRAKSAYAENVDPILVRMRLYGLSEIDARDQKAQTVVGRLLLKDRISEREYNAAQDFLKLREHYQRALKSPDALRTARGFGEGSETEAYEVWCKKAVKRYENAIKAVRAEQNRAGLRANLYAALDYTVCRDQEFAHMVPDAVRALDALAEHFGSSRRPGDGNPIDGSDQIAA